MIALCVVKSDLLQTLGSSYRKRREDFILESFGGNTSKESRELFRDPIPSNGAVSKNEERSSTEEDRSSIDNKEIAFPSSVRFLNKISFESSSPRLYTKIRWLKFT